MAIFIALGIFLIIVASFVLWAGTGGSEWNSTHNRLFQKTDRVSATQVKINNVLARVIGPSIIILAAVMIVLAATHKITAGNGR